MDQGSELQQEKGCAVENMLREKSPAVECSGSTGLADLCSLENKQSGGKAFGEANLLPCKLAILTRWTGRLHFQKLESAPSSALHCTALHCTALHCTALHCTALLHCKALFCKIQLNKRVHKNVVVTMAIVCQCSADSAHCGINTDGTVGTACVLSSSKICCGQWTEHVFFLALRSGNKLSVISSPWSGTQR